MWRCATPEFQAVASNVCLLYDETVLFAPVRANARGMWNHFFNHFANLHIFSILFVYINVLMY